MKEKRHEKILELIQAYDVSTQEELCARLNEAGYKVTQATVSRDMRELMLTKTSVGGKKQKYIVQEQVIGDLEGKYTRVFREGVVSIDMAQNILVIKTVSGMAMAVAVALDAMNCQEIVGSIAGDDTILCAVRTVEDTEKLVQQLRLVSAGDQ